MEPITISIRAACQAVGVGVTTLYQLINDGRLETVTIGQRRLVKVSSIRRLIGDTEQEPE